MLIAEELEPCLMCMEVVQWRSWKGSENSSSGTVVTSNYFLQPVEELAKKHSVAPWPLTSTTSARSWPCSRNCAPAAAWAW